MGRRFTSASNERIHVGTAAGLAGLNFLFGTFAVVATRASSGATTNSLMATNNGSGACFGIFVVNADTVGTWDSANVRTSTFTLPISTDPFMLVHTKATGTVTPRVHRLVFGTGVWTHEAMSGASVNSAANTSVTIGSNSTTSTEPWDGEIWAMALWSGIVMSDLEVERLSRGRWAELSPDFYMPFDGSREVGDMTTSFGTCRVAQTARTGTTRGVLPKPPGFEFGAPGRRR